VALEWLGEPYRLCRVHMPDVSQSADYKAINPIGETPALITSEGHVISEGLAIFHHIAARGLDKGSLGFPQGSPEFDAFNRMLSFLVTRFFSAFNPLWFAYEFLDAPEKKAVLHEEGKALVEAAFGKLEALLGERSWLVGDRISMAEAYYVGVARWADFHSIIDWADFPRARALYDRTEADPAIAFAHAIEQGEAPAGTGAFQGHVELADIAARLRAGKQALAA
jgi:glutathione S-transferase